MVAPAPPGLIRDGWPGVATDLSFRVAANLADLFEQSPGSAAQPFASA
jgi:hypothetical protein